MNFYEYHQPGEKLDQSPVYLAAMDLMRAGMHVIPIKKGTKEPEALRSVYEIISKPINEHNFDFYFNRDVDLGLIMDHNMEFIDIDQKNKAGITEKVLKAIRAGWPELFDKLVIDYTPSGGCHLIYRSEVIGGKPVLAKVKSSPNPLAIIERINRNNKQYIKISPSEGYDLKQKNPFDIPFITAEERNFISAVCASFNELPKPEVRPKEAAREDSPWSTYNRTHDWKYISAELIDRNWIVYRDDEEKIYVRRPGDTKQKYSGIIFKDTNTLYLFTASSEFENEKPYTPFGVYCLFYHDNDIAAASKKLAFEGIGINIYNEGQFWKRAKSKIEIKYTDLLQWFHLIGYRTCNKSIVQVIDNVVTISKDNDMIRAFLNEVEFEIRDEMYEKIPTIFKEKGGLMNMLHELEDNFIRDDEKNTWIFFKNFALKISATEFEPIEYKNLNGYIWHSSIINREFYECTFRGCDADRFIEILGGEKKRQLQDIIGYCISRYKDPINPRAVILMEDIDAEEEGESQGGSGKGLCFQFIKQFRKSADFDGKNFRFADPFLYQNVDPDTDIIFIDDVEKNFRFTSLFSIITGPLLVNKKNAKQVVIPFDLSPKIVVTSNYSVGGMDISSRRRKYEFPVVKHFGEEIEPVDEFNRQFFTGWDQKEWLRFDNFIAECCQMYLAESNKKDIGSVTANSAERSLTSNTHKEFVDYMDRQLAVNFFDFSPGWLKNLRVTEKDGTTTTNAVNVREWLRVCEDPDNYFVIEKQPFLEKVQKLTGYKNLTTSRLTQWVNKWAEVRNVEINTRYQRLAGSDKKYRIITWDFKIISGDDHFESGYGWKPIPE